MSRRCYSALVLSDHWLLHSSHFLFLYAPCACCVWVTEMSLLLPSTPLLLHTLTSYELPGPRSEPIAIVLLHGRSIRLLSKFVSLYPQVSSALRSHQQSFCVQWTVVSEKRPHVSKTTRQFMWCHHGTVSRLLMWSWLGGNTMNDVTENMSQTWLCRWCHSLFQPMCTENILCPWHVLIAEKTGQQATSLAL